MPAACHPWYRQVIVLKNGILFYHPWKKCAIKGPVMRVTIWVFTKLEYFWEWVGCCYPSTTGVNRTHDTLFIANNPQMESVPLVHPHPEFQGPLVQDLAFHCAQKYFQGALWLRRVHLNSPTWQWITQAPTHVCPQRPVQRGSQWELHGWVTFLPMLTAFQGVFNTGFFSPWRQNHQIHLLVLFFQIAGLPSPSLWCTWPCNLIWGFSKTQPHKPSPEICRPLLSTGRSHRGP